MKKILFVSLFVFVSVFVSSPLAAQTPADCFAEGNEAYKRADYQQAIAAYTSILDAGYENADLYYNLGNAYYRTEQYGLAILNYERSLRLKPNFIEAQQNLALANARTEDKITPLPEFLLARWWRALVNLFTFSGWLVVILVVGVLAMAAAFLFRFHPLYGWRKGGLIALIVLGILFIVSVCCAVHAGYRYSHRDRAVVTQPMAVVKGSPDEGGVDKIILHEGTTLYIDETLDGWHKIHLADGNTGWLPSEEITVI